jgi:hypothetical protein
MSRMSENVGSSTSRNPKGLHVLYRDNFTFTFYNCIAVCLNECCSVMSSVVVAWVFCYRYCCMSVSIFASFYVPIGVSSGFLRPSENMALILTALKFVNHTSTPKEYACILRKTNSNLLYNSHIYIYICKLKMTFVTIYCKELGISSPQKWNSFVIHNNNGDN